MNFSTFITRLDEIAIQEIIGKNAIHILSSMDTDLTRLSKLQSVLLNIYSPYELLLNDKIRKLFFTILKPNEAYELALVYKISNNNNPYEFLEHLKFRSEDDLNKLYVFFELPIPTYDIENQAAKVNEITPTYALFDHQRKAVLSLNRYLYSENKRVLLHMPTGSGKTRTAMNIICNHLRLNEPTIVIWFANTEELCEQAASEFEKAWSLLGNRDLTTVRYWGDTQLEITSVRDGFIVAGLKKIYNLLERSLSSIGKLATQTSLIVMDEAHMAVAPTYKLILETLTSFKAPLLGLSATPGRTWNNPTADEELASLFNKRKVTLQISGYDNPVNYLVDRGYLAKVKNTSLLYENGLKITSKDIEYLHNYLQLPEKILKSFSEDKQRNILIVKKVEQLISQHRRIILFALNVEHSNLIATILQSRGINAFSITSKTEVSQRRRLIELYKSDNEESIVLCNYGILTTGFDAPKTSCAVITRPTDSLVLYSQMVGRAIRGINAGGNAEAEIVTVIDTCLPGFDEAATAFFNWEDVWE